MKILNLMIKLLAISMALVFTSCSDDEDSIPVVSFEKTTYSLAENQTTALQVKVFLDIPAPTATAVNIRVGGTAVEGTHYGNISKKVVFRPGESEAVIFINPINVTLIGDDTVLELSLVSGDFFQLDPNKSTATVNILDNKAADPDGAVVSFPTVEYVTNAYLQDTVVVTVGITEQVDKDINIPLTINGDALAETNYIIEGLSDNNELLLKQGELSAAFNIIIKNTDELNIDKSIVVGFDTPVVTDYAISTTNNSSNINIIDPVVENVWFLDKQTYTDQTGNEVVLQKADENGHLFYSDGRPVTEVKEGIYMPEVDRKDDAGVWKDLGPNPRVYSESSNPNLWKGDWVFIYKYVKAPGSDPYYDYYKLNTSNNLDIRDFFPSGYLATYGDAMYKLDTYLRFAAIDKEAKEGKVVLPEQTIIAYVVKDGYTWKGKTEVTGFGEQYNYKIDSNDTQGDVSSSSNVKAVSIIVSGEGTYNINTKLVEYKVKFTCDDPNFTADEVEYRIYPLRGDEPVLE